MAIQRGQQSRTRAKSDLTLQAKMKHGKVWLAGKLLDIAEALPETKRGPINYLQTVRGFQRKHADERTREAKPPANNQIALSSIRMVETYSIENFDRVRLAIDRLFPDLQRQDPTRSDLLNELDQSIRSLNAGAWWNIGMLVRERGRRMWAVPVREVPQIPSEVEWIHVHAHHILPSIAILAFDVQLTDDAAAELNRVQACPYLPEISFRSLVRWESGHSELPVEWVRQREVRNWVDSLRTDVEEILKRFIGDGLFSVEARKSPRLPAVEVYILSSKETAFSDDWNKQARWWLESYGIEPLFNAYRSDADLFQWPDVGRRRNVEVSGHLLTVWRENYLTTIQHAQAYGGEKNAVLHRVEDALNSLMPAVVTLQLLRQSRKVIEELRERVFKSIRRGNSILTVKPLALPTSLHAELLVQSMLLSRLKAEFSRHKEWISHDMRGWDELKFVPSSAGTNNGLAADSVKWIEHELETIEEHLALARDAFGEHFTARNTRAIYWLTVAVTVLTVVQVLTNRDVRSWLGAGVSLARALVARWHP